MQKDVYLQFWGKARRALAGWAPWHPLAYHSLDVAAVAEALLVQGICRVPSPWNAKAYQKAIIVLLAFHDIGKFSRTFQAKSLENWPEILGANDGCPPDPGHGVTGALMLSGKLGDRVRHGLFEPSWPSSARNRIIGAIAGHHGRPVTSAGNGKLAENVACNACVCAARGFFDDVISLLEPRPLPSFTHDDDLSPALEWWLAGFTTLADWIGSSEKFPYEAPTYDLATYWQKVARPRATGAVAEFGLAHRPANPNLTLGQLIPASQVPQPSPLQVAITTLDIGTAGAVVVLIEDQTGSGKTEAALLLANRLMVQDRAAGVFVALPTMATANAMYERLAAAYQTLFASDTIPSLILTHGRSRDHAGFLATIRDAGANAGTDSSAYPDSASAQCAAWLAEDRRRAFLADIGVGTIDQALLAILPARHAALRLQCLHRRILIIDEAHAYDPYMTEELCRLLTFHVALGGSAVILSATLPTATRSKLARACATGFGTKLAAPVSLDYPLITVLRANGVTEQPCGSRADRAFTLPVKRIGDMDEAIAHIIAAANEGGAIAWVRNSVADAVAAHVALLAVGIPAILFHARFAMGDRLAIEGNVLARFGKNSTRRAGVVVATQVIEQSLDLDFDLMVSDLAPIDLLIQRAGRVWRHKRTDRPLPAAQFLVLSPEPEAQPGADWLGTALRRTGTVYPDHALLWRSAKLLFAAGAIVAPGGIRQLVEAAYAADAEVPQELAASANRAEGKGRAGESLAGQSMLNWKKGYVMESGWADDNIVRTRIGENSRIFRMARWDGGCLRPWCEDNTPSRAWALSEIPVPQRMADSVTSDGPWQSVLAAVKAGWTEWEQEIPVLVLTADRGSWAGQALRGGTPVTLHYDSQIGLRS